jgi:hypothetical protein
MVVAGNNSRGAPRHLPPYMPLYSPAVWHVVWLLQASTLVVVEHRNSKLASPTLNTLTAAGQLGGDVTALVGGKGVQQVAEQAAALPGVNKVRCLPPFLLAQSMVVPAPCQSPSPPVESQCITVEMILPCPSALHPGLVHAQDAAAQVPYQPSPPSASTNSALEL